MNDILFKSLKTKYAGLSDALLIRVAEALAKTVQKEEDAQAAVDGAIALIVQIEGDRRVTEMQKAAKAKETQKKPEDGDGAKKTVTEVTDDTPEWAKTQMKFLNDMNERIARMEGEKVTTTRKQQLDETIKNASEGFKTQITKNFGYMTFKDDEAYSAWLEETKKDAETNAAEALVTGAPKGAGSVNKDEVPKAVKDYIESKKEGDGQPF